MAGRGGCAGHAVNPSMGARFSHPCEKTVLHSHPAPPSTGSWWPWVGATAFLLSPIAVAAHGSCLGSGGWVAGDRREAGAEREPTGTYLRRVHCHPPGPARKSRRCPTTAKKPTSTSSRILPALAPPSTGSWWPWVGVTAFLLSPIAMAAHGNCQGSGGWVAGDRREAGAEREPTGTYLRRVPCSPPARPSQEITALPHHRKKTYFSFLTNSSGVSPAFDRFMVAMRRRYRFSSSSHRGGGARKLSGVGRVGCGGLS